MRTARGSVLLEAMIAAVLVLIAISSLASAMTQSAKDSAIARDDQVAWAIAEAELERLQARAGAPRTWVPGVVGPTAVAGHPGWQLTITIVEVPDPSTAGVTLRRALVQVDYRTRVVQLETARWLSPIP